MRCVSVIGARVDLVAAKGGDILYEPSKIGCQFRGQVLVLSALAYIDWAK